MTGRLLCVVALIVESLKRWAGPVVFRSAC